MLKNDVAHGLTVSPPNRDKLTMRAKPLKTRDLILSLSKDEAKLALQSFPLLVGQQFDGVAHFGVQPFSSRVQMSKDRRAHSRIPELFNVVQDALNGCVPLLACEERSDLIGHHDKFFRLHGARASP